MRAQRDAYLHILAAEEVHLGGENLLPVPLLAANRLQIRQLVPQLQGKVAHDFHAQVELARLAEDEDQHIGCDLGEEDLGHFLTRQVGQ